MLALIIFFFRMLSPKTSDKLSVALLLISCPKPLVYSLLLL